jgi:hypothetical protein
MQTPSADYLVAVWALGTDAWTVGNSTVMRYDGTSWTNIYPNAVVAFTSVWASAPNDVYAAGPSVLRHFNGATWAGVNPGIDTVLGVWGAASNNVFVIGHTPEVVPGGDSPIVYHFDGTAWSQVTICPAMTSRLTSITGTTNPLRVYIASPDGVCRFNGTAWAMMSTDATRQVVAVSSTEVYALLYGQFSKWSSGTTWMPGPIPGDLNAMASPQSGSLLGCGDAGVVLGRAAGTWTHYVTPTEQHLNAIAATSENNVFIVGDAGTVLH